MTADETNRIILSAFSNARYGVSPTATRGAVEGHAKKQGLVGTDYTVALDGAIAAGLVATMSDSSLTIRNAGRAMIGKR